MNDSEEKKTTNQKKNDSGFGIVLQGFFVMIITAVIFAVYFSLSVAKVNVEDAKNRIKYDKHYVFIASNTEQEFWDEVYNSAYEKASQNGILLERLGDNLSGDYSTVDLLRMAVHSSVDGILYSGEATETTISLINEAVADNTFVIILRNDIDESDRQCFVGVNTYDIGVEYGNQIKKIISGKKNKNKKIRIFADAAMAESSQSIIQLAIRDALTSEDDKSQYEPDVELQLIDTSDAFSAEEAIRDIFMDEENLPDIMVCLNTIFTQCAYQAAVDYNKVGDVNIIGYYSSGNVLDAIEKNIITSTIRVETKEMGESCVNVMMDYEETGYANSYVSVSTKVIDQQEAERMLNEETSESTRE